MGHCGKYEERIARFLHGELLLQEREELESHIAVCAVCERLYREVTDLDRLLRELPGRSIDPPPFLRTRILANLAEEGRAAPAVRRFGGWAAALAATAACALIAFALFRGEVPREPRVASLPPAESPQVAPPEPAPAPQDPAPKVQVVREVRIYFYHPPARQVAVTGDFNGWNPEGVPLRATGKPGLWETTLRLPPGAYSYNLIVDGNVLVPDPNAPAQAPDGYGGTNSILLVRGDSA